MTASVPQVQIISMCVPYVVLFRTLHDLIKRDKCVIASYGILLQVTQVNIGGN